MKFGSIEKKSSNKFIIIMFFEEALSGTSFEGLTPLCYPAYGK